MKLLFIILISILFFSCNKSEKIKLDTSLKTSGTHSENIKDNAEINFEEKKEEKCETEEELQAKLLKKKEEVFQLQGGEPGCDPNEKKK